MVLASLKDEISNSAGCADVETGRTDSSTTDHSHRLSSNEPSGALSVGSGEEEEPETNADEMPTPGVVTVVESLQAYEGANIYEKVDALIAAHPVVLFNRSWCLFSIDAVDFLMRMGVSLQSFELDNQPHETAIVKYLKQKYEHETSPWIFMSGDFVGGYEDVNTLYSQGTLQREYLSRLTQADRCEIVAAKSTTKPLFCFPVKVNAHAVRATGVVTSLVATISCVLSLLVPHWGQMLAYYLVIEFTLRIIGGARIAPLGVLAGYSVSWLEPKPRSGRPKQFACCCGLLFSLLGSVCYLAPFPYHTYLGSVFLGILALCCGMEGFLDFCLGCVFFRIGLQLRIIPR